MEANFVLNNFLKWNLYNGTSQVTIAAEFNQLPRDTRRLFLRLCYSVFL
jgi:hypothetical protein